MLIIVIWEIDNITIKYEKGIESSGKESDGEI